MHIHKLCEFSLLIGQDGRGTLNHFISLTVVNISCAILGTISTGGVDIFGGEFDSFDLKGGDFGGGMEDIEVPRNAQDANFGDERDITEKSNVQVNFLIVNGADSTFRTRSQVIDFCYD